jgi:putative ABC transport system ATP-binding protein
MSVLLKVSNISKIYGDNSARFVALKNVSFQVEAGEFVGIIGPSGSGKSTLLSILGAMNQPTEGRVVVDGIDVYGLSVERQADFRREYLGFVFQQLQLIPYLTALENVMLPLVVTTLKDHEKIATEMLEKVGLGKKLNRLPSQLSGGEQGRVAIARAIVNRPPILLADEPTGSLDSVTSKEILSLFNNLHSRGQTIILVTHDPEAVESVSRLIQIRDGEIAADESGKT